jgi:hypothetical protein
MAGMLGLETLNPQQNMILYGFPSPPVDLIKDSIYGTPIGSLGDGTQIWKITHNGVDTHTIHWHLANVQLINRVAWDNALRLPDDNELGWKDTIRINPLQDTIIALRPFSPASLPFQVPNSVRLIDPTMPENEPLRPPSPGTWFDPQANPLGAVTNHLVNFGWEYTVHCHILAHEEMDMMHALVFGVPPLAPSNLTATAAAGTVNLTWTDNSLNETRFIIERAEDAGFTVNFVSFEAPENATTYADPSVAGGITYYYRVKANNLVGDTEVYQAPSLGFPTMSLDSPVSAPVSITVVAPGPAAPTNLQAVINDGPLRITLTWIDASNNETSFAIWRSTNGGPFGQIGTVTRTPAQSTATGGTVTFNNTDMPSAPLVPGSIYSYYVIALNAQGSSGPSNTVTVNFSAPAAPTNLAGTAVRIPGNRTQDRVTLTWVDNANNEAGFQIQRSLFANFRFPSSFTVGPNVQTFTQNVSRAFNFYYRVRARNAVGNSGWSNPVLVITP